MRSLHPALLALVLDLETVLLEFLLDRLELWAVHALPPDRRHAAVGRARCPPPEWRFSKAPSRASVPSLLPFKYGSNAMRATPRPPALAWAIMTIDICQHGHMLAEIDSVIMDQGETLSLPLHGSTEMIGALSPCNDILWIYVSHCVNAQVNPSVGAFTAVCACFYYTSARRASKKQCGCGRKSSISSLLLEGDNREGRGRSGRAAPHPLPSKTLARTEEGGA